MSKKIAFELDAETRDDQGKGASRRLRRIQNRVPGILYGGDEKPANISLDHKKLMHALEHQAFYSHLLTLNLNNHKQQVILKDLQRHPYKKHALIHIDFQRVRATDKIHMRVPLHFIGEKGSPGVEDGGVVNHQMIDIDIRCIASELPEFIEVDLSHLKLNEIIHVSDLKLPKGIEPVALAHGKDPAIVNIHLPRAAILEEQAEAAAAEASAATTAAAGATPAAGGAAKGAAGGDAKAKADDKGKGGKK